MNTQPHYMNDKTLIQLLKSDKSDDVNKALEHIKMLSTKKDKISDEILVLMLKMDDADNIALKYIIKQKQDNVISKLRVPQHMNEKDIFHHALFELWKYVRKYDFDTSKEGAIERFLYVVCRRYINRNSGKGDTDMDEFPELADYILFSMTEEEISLLLDIFDKLGKGCKEILRLKYFEGMSDKEIAQKLNRTDGSTRTRYSQCLKTLKEWIAEDDDLAEYIRNLLTE